MTQEDKQLLLRDLCARLPHGVVIKITSDGGMVEASYDMRLDAGLLADLLHSEDDFIPYLRPLSSMTEEEKIELDNMEFEMQHLKVSFYAHECLIHDFFYKHHLDIRGLIPMGLALEAPKDMYKLN